MQANQVVMMPICSNLENARESAGLGILPVHLLLPLFEFYSSSLSVCNVELGGGTKW